MPRSPPCLEICYVSVRIRLFPRGKTDERQDHASPAQALSRIKDTLERDVKIKQLDPAEEPRLPEYEK